MGECWSPRSWWQELVHSRLLPGKNPTFSYFLLQFLKINIPAKVEKRPKCLLAPSRSLELTFFETLGWLCPILLGSHFHWLDHQTWLESLNSYSMKAWTIMLVSDWQILRRSGLWIHWMGLSMFMASTPVRSHARADVFGGLEVGWCVWANNVLLHFST